MALLELRDLAVSYGAVEAIHGIAMDIEEGNITTVIGSNGAGKTTIINAISGMVRRSGTIVYAGKVLSDKSHVVVKHGIIQIPEGRKVFAGLSVEENLRLGAYTVKNRKEIPELLEQQYQLFPRLQERNKQDAGTLSGGEQQMLVICRALMGKPRLLMLDEPSLGLAPLIVKEVFEIIKAIRQKGVTILLVEQNANKSLEICDIGYVIENGHVVLKGTGSELLRNGNVIKAYLGSKK
jgi:branched-chain amino acid transport system ATP-binding protein